MTNHTPYKKGSFESMTELKKSAARVLQVLASLDRGGAEQLVLDWYKEMDRDKIQFDFVVYERDEPYDHEETLRSMGARIFKLPYPWGPKLLPFLHEWRQLLRDHPEWHIIHAHYTTTAPLYFPMARLEGRKCVVHGHSASRDIKWPLHLAAFALANTRLACSEQVQKGRMRPVKSEVLVNGISPLRFTFELTSKQKVRTELGLGDGIVLGHIGRFSQEKNHSFLLEIFAELLKLEGNANLLLVGQGLLQAKIRKKATDLGVEDRVHFLGLRTDIPQIMSALDLLIMPSLFEGMPITMIEAQANGLPCLTSDVVSDDSIIPDVGTVEMLALSDSAETWAKTALAMAVADHGSRKEASEKVVNTPYDIGSSVRRLLEIYGLATFSRYRLGTDC